MTGRLQCIGVGVALHDNLQILRAGYGFCELLERLAPFRLYRGAA